ncbi:LSU ribosomal protein L25P [Thalassoporum mexicanum PCC 7367]|uniref:50S ribosomal protein L25 n=1 Tax=Thalassoporum mexicanum TaxID=3457544 RepID=UPI00029FDC45|nr:50S ribosomal protein L25 [Pseudanabaena sp. PCC 7367]AFY70523.1 LSU ribosomal protein L25P [Pseudanabaena sp. PCC 7367]
MKMNLDCTIRPENSKTRALRRDGQIPGTVYGHLGNQSTSIVVAKKDVDYLMRHAKVNNTLIKLNIADSEFDGVTVLREVQTHPFRRQVFHLSFFAIESQKAVDLDVPLNFIGTPKGIKVGGVLDILIKEVKVSCPPNNVPEKIDIHISHLDVGKGIRVGDIPLEDGQVMITDTAPLAVNVRAGRTPTAAATPAE